MHSKTKIVVLHMKELIYTGLFVLLGILLVVLLIIMFRPAPKDSSSLQGAAYIPGVYTTSLILNNCAVDLEVVVDEERVTSIRFVNLDDAVTTMYPLMQPALDEIAAQIYEKPDLSAVKYSDDNRYTATVLLEAISATLSKASLNQIPDTPEHSSDNSSN